MNLIPRNPSKIEKHGQMEETKGEDLDAPEKPYKEVRLRFRIVRIFFLVI